MEMNKVHHHSNDLLCDYRLLENLKKKLLQECLKK